MATPGPAEVVGEPSKDSAEVTPAETEETQESAEERKLRKKRENSRAWHQKWVSKGVPRVVGAQPSGALSGASNSEPAVGHRDQPDQPEPAVGPVGEPEPAEAACVTNMRDACAAFVAEWIRNCGLPPSNDRRAKAYKAWMESDQRASMLAGRAGVQM